MSELASLFQAFLQFRRQLPEGVLGKKLFDAACVALFFFCLVWALESAYGTRTRNYRSRDFLHDLAYWFYARTSMQYFVFMAGIIAAIESTGLFKLFTFFDPPAYTHLPFLLQVAFFLVLNDFIYYWMHRALHQYRPLWAFHSIHHSQERVTFVTGARFHPVESIVTNLLIYVPMRMVGFEGFVWLPIIVLLTIQIEIEHSQIPWRYGPLYKILVSPVFHSYHHAVELRYRDKHFGQTFAIWDHLFGTAVPTNAPAPTRFGVEDVNPKSFLDTLIVPFRLLREYYGSPAGKSAPRSP